VKPSGASARVPATLRTPSARRNGYYWSLAVVAATMAGLAISRWAEDYHLFILGALSFLAATIGRTARRRQRPGWVRIHMTGMGASDRGRVKT
jgi:hypothetical protein